MIKFKNKLIISGARGAAGFKVDEIFTINKKNKVKKIKLPGYTIPTSHLLLNGYVSYNVMTKDKRGNLYIIADGGKIIKTRDLKNWQEIADFDTELITINYWEKQNSLVVASKGENAKLWQIKL